MSGLFDDIDDVVPIPESFKDLKVLFNYGSIQAVADNFIQQARNWQDKHPDKDVIDVMPPTLKEYFLYRI